MAGLAACRLESARLVLDPLRAEDADELEPVLGDVALHGFTGGRPATREELRERFARQARGRSPDGREAWLNWVVRLRATGTAVGTVQATVTPSAPAAAVARLAWVIGTAHQRRGYATEAAGLVAAWLRGVGVTRLSACIHPRHEASMAVARSLGLAPTDTLVTGELRWESATGPR